MTQFEPQAVIVPKSETRFTPTEIGEFLFHHTKREPARLEGLVITWNVDASKARTVNFKHGTTLDLTLSAQVHWKEDANFVDFWVEQNINELAHFDVQRLIAFHLTDAYKQKIQALWDR
jgi:hypothetical protein